MTCPLGAHSAKVGKEAVRNIAARLNPPPPPNLISRPMCAFWSTGHHCDVHMSVSCTPHPPTAAVRDAIARRLAQCGLELHPDKTRIVCCKDENRRATYANERFDFLGYTFRPRRAKSKVGKYFVNFLPAVSDDALKEMGRELRSWRINRRSDKALDDLAQMVNIIVQGWINYYGHFYRSRLYPLLKRINTYLVRWAKRKFKRLRGSYL